MVKIFETKKYNDKIITLWQQAFGDKREDVIFFLKNAKNISCLCLYDNGNLCSMLFFVDCKVNDEDYKYIYAACTDNNFRSSGYMSQLLKYSQDNYKRILLIPADYSLVDYYSKRSFNHKADINNIIFNECDEIKEYLFEGCSLETPFALAYIGE